MLTIYISHITNIKHVKHKNVITNIFFISYIASIHRINKNLNADTCKALWNLFDFFPKFFSALQKVSSKKFIKQIIKKII